jgi:hypothetical protein
MVIDRRTFIQSTALVTTTSAAAVLMSLSSIGLSQNSQTVGPVQATVDDGTDIGLVVFRIDGWDRYDGDTALAPFSLNTITTVPTHEEIVIKINHSWRTAWR